MTNGSDLDFTAVPPSAVPYVWADVEPMIAKAVETSDGRYHTAAVLDGILKGELALWLVFDNKAPVAAITTRVVQLPKTRAMAMDWIGGDRMKEWLPMVQTTLAKYAREYGCTELQGYGRKAWGRWLEPHGWKTDYIAYKMDLSDG